MITLSRKIIRVFISCLVLAFILTSCTDKESTIRIATKPQTEQYILGEMLKALIEQDTGLNVELTSGIGGGTANIHPAMEKGEFDLYPEYTGTAWVYVLKKDTHPGDEALLATLREEYMNSFGMEWVGFYGFNNAYGLAVRKEIADAKSLSSFSDLAPVSGQLTFGAEYDFYERDDGFTALTKAYGFVFPKHVDLDIGLKYPAINKGEIDVMNIFTTDGQLASGLVKVLEDDKHFYRTYYCGTVVRSDTLKKHPDLRPVLMKMDNVITDEEMSRLNHDVDMLGKEPRAVAVEFLQEKGLLN